VRRYASHGLTPCRRLSIPFRIQDKEKPIIDIYPEGDFQFLLGFKLSNAVKIQLNLTRFQFLLGFKGDGYWRLISSRASGFCFQFLLGFKLSIETGVIALAAAFQFLLGFKLRNYQAKLDDSEKQLSIPFRIQEYSILTSL